MDVCSDELRCSHLKSSSMDCDIRDEPTAVRPRDDGPIAWARLDSAPDEWLLRFSVKEPWELLRLIVIMIGLITTDIYQTEN